MEKMRDLGAFVDYAPLGAYGLDVNGPLNGLTLGVKYLFDGQGLRTLGARIIGKTLTDEGPLGRGTISAKGTDAALLAPGTCLDKS